MRKEEAVGICYGDEADTVVEEHAGLREAISAAKTVLRVGGAVSVDVVVLEGTGPIYSSDGEKIADCHAPKWTLCTISDGGRR
jgi:hypothetical protein